MKWELCISASAKKSARKFPKEDRVHIGETLDEMSVDPYSGDIVKLDEENSWRRRVGAYRIFYEVRVAEKSVYIFRIERRTSKTY